MEAIAQWFKIRYANLVNSIALLPAIIALLFLVVSWLMISLDFSETGKSIKSKLPWLSLRDAATARTIISAIAAGIISLTVFSFSMVMIVLNQAASQMSNRVLYKLIGNRSQQWILGFYIGTIVYALFLLSTIRDIDTGIYVPALSTYLLIALTIVDIFLFIYFLHYITTSVKYETIIGRIFNQTKALLEKNCDQESPVPRQSPATVGLPIKSSVSGIYQGFNRDRLLKLCETEHWFISFLYPEGTFILKGSPFLLVTNVSEIPSHCEKKILESINILQSEMIETNFYFGFRQLKEVAVKALSPGINDPGTAILSLHAIADLLAFRANKYPSPGISDTAGVLRIVVKEKNFEELFIEYFLPIWDYGKNDRSIRKEIQLILSQLAKQVDSKVIHQLLREVESSQNSNSFSSDAPSINL